MKLTPKNLKTMTIDDLRFALSHSAGDAYRAFLTELERRDTKRKAKDPTPEERALAEKYAAWDVRTLAHEYPKLKGMERRIALRVLHERRARPLTVEETRRLEARYRKLDLKTLGQEYVTTRGPARAVALRVLQEQREKAKAKEPKDIERALTRLRKMDPMKLRVEYPLMRGAERKAALQLMLEEKADA